MTTDYSTITDGIFFREGHQWDQGTVWWDEAQDEEQNFLQVFLGPGCYKTTTLVIQVDNNDQYLISWYDYGTGTTRTEIVTPTYINGGMAPKWKKRLRPAAITDAFKIEHLSDGDGDGNYSVSEFKALGWAIRSSRCKAPVTEIQ